MAFILVLLVYQLLLEFIDLIVIITSLKINLAINNIKIIAKKIAISLLKYFL